MMLKSYFFFVSSAGKMAMIFNVFTYNDKFNLAGLVDESTGVNCKELMEDFVNLLNEKIILMKDEME